MAGLAGAPVVSTPSPVRRIVAKQDFQRLASQVTSEASSSRPRNFAPSPLDFIPSDVYTRFPRLSTTDTSSPDLSAEEMISTRLSIDEHAMVHNCPNLPLPTVGRRDRLHGALRKAISSPALGYQKVKARLRRAPSTLSGKTMRQEVTSPSEQRSLSTTDYTSISDMASSSCSPIKEPDTIINGNKNPNLRRSTKRLVARPNSNLPPLTEAIIPRGKKLAFDEQHSDARKGPERNLQPLTSRALRAFNRSHSLPITTQHACSPPRDHAIGLPSGLPKPYSGSLNHSLQRTISLGSIDELRSNSYIATSQRVFSFSSTASMASSANGGRSGLTLPDHFPPQQARPFSSGSSADYIPTLIPLKPVTVDDLSSLNQLRQEPLFIDIQGDHRPEFHFPPSVQARDAPVARRSLRGAKAHTYKDLRHHQTMPLLIRSTSIQEDLERSNCHRKLPVYVPKRIVRLEKSLPSLPQRVSSTTNIDSAIRVGDAMNDKQSHASSPTVGSSKLSECSNSAHCCYEHKTEKLEICSASDDEIKSGNPAWWDKATRFLAIFNKASSRIQKRKQRRPRW